jgi:choline-glycine betaine transporter
MPTGEQIRQFLTGVILPPVAGVAATWIVANVHVLNLFNINEAAIAGELTQLDLLPQKSCK